MGISVLIEYNVVDGKPYVAALNGKEDDPDRGMFSFVYLETLSSDKDPKIMEEIIAAFKYKHSFTFATGRIILSNLLLLKETGCFKIRCAIHDLTCYLPFILRRHSIAQTIKRGLFRLIGWHVFGLVCAIRNSNRLLHQRFSDGKGNLPSCVSGLHQQPSHLM
ncbi:hypothetical protein AVEN_76823-1 [Araneus ventricosus]|uniref:Uncharacterized protein n=1 Tax=Araneus ventricosus TaxID=182803 RepID=A0A4Y2HZJ4_ARAVE|nr:hypothetical protein AVEN_76823-1 [Araneus ventricosus]